MAISSSEATKVGIPRPIASATTIAVPMGPRLSAATAPESMPTTMTSREHMLTRISVVAIRGAITAVTLSLST